MSKPQDKIVFFLKRRHCLLHINRNVNMNKYNKNHAYLQDLDVCTFLSGEKMHIHYTFQLQLNSLLMQKPVILHII